jgi:hypothetical protein
MESEKDMNSAMLNTLQEEYSIVVTEYSIVVTEYSIVVTESPHCFCYTQLYGTEDRR